MSAKIAMVLCLLVVVVSSVPAQPGWGAAGGWGGAGAWGGAGGNGAANPWIPPWLASAPWFPQWVQCTGIGSECVDCNTKLICTKIGGLQRACSDPTLPYCNLGECSATASAECGGPTVPVAPAAV